MTDTKKTKQRGTFFRVLKQVGRYKPLLLLSLLSSAATSAMMLYVPILVGRAINSMVDAGRVDFDTISDLFLQIIVIVLATGIVRYLLGIVNNRITYHVVYDVRTAAFDKIGRLPLSYLDTHTQGDTVSRIITDVDTFADGLLLGFSQLFTGIITIIGTLIFMLYLHPLIALAVVVITPLSLFAARFIAGRTYRMFHRQAEVRGEETAFIDEMIVNRRVVTAYGREDENADTFDEIDARLSRASLSAIFFSSLTNPVTRFVNSLVYAVVALAGALVVIKTAGTAAAFTVGSLTAFLSYANQYTKPFNEISGVITEFQNALACASRVFRFIDEREEIPDAPDALAPGDVRGTVDFTNVSFSYTPEKPLLQSITLHVNAGDRIAIVGPTGCGKTTLINLIMRFYDVTEGGISIDGTDIRQMRRSSLRGNIGMVLQESWIRRATVRDNITLGKEGVSDEEVRAAARAAHADSFIRRLPNGYDTLLSEEGGVLSQGQKQLLSIARIMLSLPPMLILDEATSSIDTRTEMKIQDAFAHMMQGRTSFIVAHRLSTIREASSILVMKDGNIIEEGRHEELLARRGFYAYLYESQFTNGSEQSDA